MAQGLASQRGGQGRVETLGRHHHVASTISVAEADGYAAPWRGVRQFIAGRRRVDAQSRRYRLMSV